MLCGDGHTRRAVGRFSQNSHLEYLDAGDGTKRIVTDSLNIDGITRRCGQGLEATQHGDVTRLAKTAATESFVRPTVNGRRVDAL